MKAALACLALLGLLSACAEESARTATGKREPIAVASAMGGVGEAGFAQAIEPRRFTFPADHAAHPRFKHEWWYFTGHLFAADGQRFGYQVTLFRIALSPVLALETIPRRSRWAARQVWMAHAALSDIGENRHHAEEKLVREALGLAGSQAQPLMLWAEDWRISHDAATQAWRIDLTASDFTLHLDLAPLRQPLLQGDQGRSQKGAAPGNASYYYSIPRLRTSGSLQIAGRDIAVTGLSWLDREWSTSALDENQLGWDWFSAQLADGSDFMYYQIRRGDGSIDPNSHGVLVSANGQRIELAPGNVTLTPDQWWQSPSGGRYPVTWEMTLPTVGALRISALMPAQLMDLSVRYWEGAVTVHAPGNAAEIGQGYLEMTGY